MRRLIVWLSLISVTGCASSNRSTPPVAAPAPARTTAAAPAASAEPPSTKHDPPLPAAASVENETAHPLDRIDALRLELLRIFEAPNINHALWGIEVQAVSTGE